MYSMLKLLRSWTKSIFTAPVQVKSATIRNAQFRPEQLEDRLVPAATDIWLGPIAGDPNANNLWSTAGNWQNQTTGKRATVAPGANDTAEFNNTQGNNCFVTAATQVGTLQLDGYTGTLDLIANLTVGGGSMATPTPQNQNKLIPTIDGTGNLVIGMGAAGTFTWKSGTMAGTGQTIVSGGATLNIASGTGVAGASTTLAGRSLTIQTLNIGQFAPPAAAIPGTVNLSSGQLVLQNNPNAPNQAAVITNYGNFQITGSATAITSTGSALFKNLNDPILGTGTVTLSITNLNFTMGVAFNNQSTVTLTQGSLVLNSGGLSAGTWQMAQPCVLSFQNNGNTVSQYTWNTSTFSGAGVLQITGPTITVQAAAGTNVPPQIMWNTPTAFNGGTINVVPLAGEDVQTNILLTSNLVWNNGTFSGNTGVLGVRSGALVTIVGVANTQSVPTLTGGFKGIANAGKITLGKVPGGSASDTPVTLFMNGNAIRNIDNGSITVFDTSGISMLAGGKLGGIYLGTSGTITKVADSGLSVFQVQFVTEGTNKAFITLTPGAQAGSSSWQQISETGTVMGSAISGAKPPPAQPPAQPPKGLMFRGPLNLDGTAFGLPAGGQLVGDGQIVAATFANNGELLPGDVGNVGTLSFVGDLTDTATAITAEDLGGNGTPVAGTDYDQITVANGMLTLAGALQLTVLPTLTAPVGTTFTLLDDTEASSPLTTTFANLPDGATIEVGGWVFQINYNSTTNEDGTYNNTVNLTVTGTPSSSTNTGSVSGVVWNDSNGNGTYDSGEPLLSGVAVSLIDTATGNALDTFTDANGAYSFTNLAAGNYQVQFDPTTNPALAGDRFTTTNADSLANQTTGDTAAFTLDPLVPLTDVSAGLVSFAPPVGTDDAYSVNLGSSLTESAADGVLSNDTDPAGYAITAVLVDPPQDGTLTLNPDGSFTYAANAGFVGSDQFSYEAQDAYGPGNLTFVSIAVVEPPPTVPNVSTSTNQDTAVTVNVLSGVTDPNSSTFAVVAASNGLDGTTAVNVDGTVTYTPNAGFSGSDSFTYTITDGYGGVSVGTATVTVNPVTGQPEANEIDLLTAQTTPVSVDLNAVTTDTSAPSSNLSYSVSGATNGTVALAADGQTVRYTAAAGFRGYDSFTYTATDSTTGLSSTATVNVLVDTPPVANPVTASTSANTPVTVNVLSATSDPNGDLLTVVEASSASGATLTINPDGSVTYAPAPGFTGIDTFTYTVVDSYGVAVTATATVAVGLAPGATHLSLSVPMNLPAVLPSTTSPTGAPLSVTSFNQPAPGTGSVALNQYGQLVYLPPDGYVATATFSYMATDGHGHTYVITVTISVSA